MLDLIRSDPSFALAQLTAYTPGYLQLSFNREEIRSKLTYAEWRILMIDGLQAAMDRALASGLITRVTYKHDETAFVVNVYREEPEIKSAQSGDFLA